MNYLRSQNGKLIPELRPLESSKPEPSAEQLFARLTQREQQVFHEVVRGNHNREIAEKIGISPRTVEVYKARMMEKLRCERVAHLVAWAIKNGKLEVQ